MAPLLYIQDEFITRDQCKFIIDYYKSNLEYTFKNDLRVSRSCTYPLSLLDIYQENILLKNTSDRIFDICKGFEKDLKLDNLEIVKWPVKSHMMFHKDVDTDILASILYLNDNYKGGQTGFESVQVEPKIGRLMIFSNSYYLHRVKEVRGSPRYTFASWFIKHH